MSISNRRNRIKEIISSRIVCKQEELAQILNEEGYSVTQATVSRDIKELGLIKVKDAETKKSKYSLPIFCFSHFLQILYPIGLNIISIINSAKAPVNEQVIH